MGSLIKGGEGVVCLYVLDRRRIDGLAAAMGCKVEKNREKVLSDDIIFRIYMSATKFKGMAMNLDSNFFIVSFYSDSPKKRTIRKVLSKSPTVTISLSNMSD